MSITITDEMHRRAEQEANKRDPYINHHFEVGHLTGGERDIIGFLGEFACCEYLGINWKDNIRENYLTIDHGDINKNVIIDIKTETIPNSSPNKYFHRVFNKTIHDDETFGRRLIHENQMGLLENYQYVIWGAFVRDAYNKWYALGYLDTETILREYSPTSERPDGGRYPFPALPIRTSQLKDMRELQRMIR